MTLLTLSSVKKDFGIKEILRDASFSLEEGDNVGLIGTNGSGKSTLLKMIAGLEPVDGGEIWINSGAKVVYLPQQPAMDDNHTVLQQVFADAGERMALIRQYEELSHRLARSQGNLDSLMGKLSRLTEQIEAANAWDLETQAKAILSRLGIEERCPNANRIGTAKPRNRPFPDKTSMVNASPSPQPCWLSPMPYSWMSRPTTWMRPQWSGCRHISRASGAPCC